MVSSSEKKVSFQIYTTIMKTLLSLCLNLNLMVQTGSAVAEECCAAVSVVVRGGKREVKQ